MIAKDLKAELLKLNVPDDAKVFLECDHGQSKETAGSVVVSRSPVPDHEDPDCMIFEWNGWQEVYDEDCIDEYDENGKITAVLISY